jgi:selenocysteine lyase/cysteine desulfurase
LLNVFFTRDIIKTCVNATDKDVVIFTGSGTTGGIHKLVHALQLEGEEAKKTVSYIALYILRKDLFKTQP